MQWVATADGSMTAWEPTVGEWYHSRAGAFSEGLTVFVEPFFEHARAHPKEKYFVLDVGFGLGLNWLGLIDRWLHDEQLSQKALHVVSVEIDQNVLEATLPQGAWQNLLNDSSLCSARDELAKNKTWSCRSVTAQLITGDVQEETFWEQLAGVKFDAVFFDLFSPQKVPHLWGDSVMAQIANASHEQTVFLTYTVARLVRESLMRAGFTIRKQPGFAGKRERLQAYRLK